MRIPKHTIGPIRSLFILIIRTFCKIRIPSKLQSRIIAWYHKYLAHPGGENRTKDMISQICTWPQMWSQVKAFCKTCPQCQLWKRKCP
jgi:hypothetical protein